MIACPLGLTNLSKAPFIHCNSTATYNTRLGFSLPLLIKRTAVRQKSTGLCHRCKRSFPCSAGNWDHCRCNHRGTCSSPSSVTLVIRCLSSTSDIGSRSRMHPIRAGGARIHFITPCIT
ncbi:hypothetical protein BKA82DRAFT_904946 [Pisolithus tinctorius]|uniref:C2H2-type domain-containing protein n=1 Tax=Pisolithus tinctorius Marx 270 TaxID=870435 RepID=A0A0C3P9Z5_PISTI|nr:hypothetical protein BKA82DRAFT_904946 [Pisolithus tinctorius]KIO10390.1 hypothetical protein M404DRAFT_904946 [Pisolithus tinctorius Marx 270]